MRGQITEGVQRVSRLPTTPCDSFRSTSVGGQLSRCARSARCCGGGATDGTLHALALSWPPCVKSPRRKDLSSDDNPLTSSTAGAMIPRHMSKSIHSSIATLQSSARGIMSVAMLAIGVSACHHSAPAPSMIMTPVPRDQAHTEATRAQLQELAVTTEADAGKAPDATTRQQKQM